MLGGRLVQFSVFMNLSTSVVYCLICVQKLHRDNNNRQAKDMTVVPNVSEPKTLKISIKLLHIQAVPCRDCPVSESSE